jgi:hypothetical protein
LFTLSDELKQQCSEREMTECLKRLVSVWTEVWLQVLTEKYVHAYIHANCQLWWCLLDIQRQFTSMYMHILGKLSIVMMPARHTKAIQKVRAVCM